MIKRILLSLLVLATLVTPLVSTPVAAQTADRESITMSPTSRKYKIDAGATVTDKLTIVNDGSTAYDFLVYARPYTIMDNNYESPNFTATTPRADLYGWVQFPKTKFHLEAGASVDVPYTIRVPAGVAPGGHYGVIFAETQPVENEGAGNAVIRKKRVGSIMYATVNGQYRESGEVTGYQLPFWQVEPPLHAQVAAKNTGNTDFTDNVRLTVKDVFGNVKYEAKKDYQVLPDTTRTISLDWENAPWFGLFKVETEQQFLGQSEKNEGYVLMMPRFIPVALFVIILIGGIYAWTRRRKK